MPRQLEADDLTTLRGRYAASIRRMRIKAGIRSQREMAEMIGVSAVTISHYEVGHRTPDIDVLFAIAKACECCVEDIVAHWLASDDPEHWPIDLEVYLMMKEVRYVALDFIANLPKTTDKKLIRSLQGTLVLDSQEDWTWPMRQTALELLDTHLPKRTDERIRRYLNRKVREA